VWDVPAGGCGKATVVANLLPIGVVVSRSLIQVETLRGGCGPIWQVVGMSRIDGLIMRVMPVVLLLGMLIGCGAPTDAPPEQTSLASEAPPAEPRRIVLPSNMRPLRVAESPSMVGIAAATDGEDDTTSVVPWARPVIRTDQIAAAAHRADVQTRRGFSLARRGMRLSARREFVESLRILAEALDESRDCHAHRDALARGLLALEESRDLNRHGALLAEATAGHQTPILDEENLDRLTFWDAQQRYLDYAYEQLAAVAPSESVASLALYGLGRSEAVAVPYEVSAGAAVACYRAALAVDARNSLASHELGIHLARREQ
jgi:hypothetical protein